MLECRNATKRFRSADGGNVDVLSGLDIRFEPGQFVSLVGPSGCGKTTVLRALAGLEQLDDGMLTLDGKRIHGPHRDRGMVFQSFALFPWLTVRDNISWGPSMSGQRTTEFSANIDHYLSLTGLTQFADAYPHTLSGGMKQRVAIARTLANGPRVILMDEPFGALDAQTRSGMQDFLAQLWERESKTVVFVTHDLEEALFLSDRVLLLSQRPARILRDVTVPFLRPRRHELKYHDEFYALKRELLLALDTASTQRSTQP